MNVRDFRANLSKYLDAADKGEIVYIERNGKVYTMQRIEQKGVHKQSNATVYTEPKYEPMEPGA